MKGVINMFSAINSVPQVSEVSDQNYSQSFLSRVKELGLDRSRKVQRVKENSLLLARKSKTIEIPQYANNHLVRRLMNKMAISREDADQLFADLMRFLALCGNFPGNKLSPPKRIDEAWHHFILFTYDYYLFCEVYYGRFIHHSPNLQSDWNSPALSGEDGSLQRTVGFAKDFFGELSVNWKFEKESQSCLKECDECRTGGSCQDADCHDS